MNAGSSTHKLIFVYNADSGRLNALQDSLHKLLSPSTYDCRLCQLTHSFFSERKQWREFIDSIDAECIFLHKDEFNSVEEVSLPAVFIEKQNKLTELITAQEFSRIESLEELIGAVNEKFKVFHKADGQ